MTDIPDAELLARFTRNESEEAFAELVRRHIALVHSVALRHTDNPQSAQEITQAVFIILARKAASLGRKVVLSGWLYHTARLTAANVRRAEYSRVRHEQEAYMQSTLEENSPDVAWLELAPLLDEAMARLGATDRDAVVLRYFENKSLSEVGAALGMEERAAQKRVMRALDKLQRIFTQRGVALTTTIIAGAVSANSVQAAPAGLAMVVTTTAAKGAVVGGSTLTLVKGALKLMAWTKMKTVIVVSAGLLLATGTTTVVVKKIEAYNTYRDSWRVQNLNSALVDQAPPQVRILPTKFHTGQNNLAENNTGTKWGGINVPVSVIAWVAYEWRPARVVFTASPPLNKYDFIATLPQGAYGALQRELKSTLGFVGRRETRDADVLLLRVRKTGATGLKPPIAGSENDWSGSGRYVGEDRTLSSESPPHLGLTRFLEQAFEIPIIDQTGLTQHFSIDLKWEPQPNRATALKAIKQALLDQLGLELVPAREKIEMLVVEKVKS